MSEPLYEIQRQGDLSGPFIGATVERMLEAGMLAQDDFFRQEGERAWRPLLMWGEGVHGGVEGDVDGTHPIQWEAGPAMTAEAEPAALEEMRQPPGRPAVPGPGHGMRGRRRLGVWRAAAAGAAVLALVLVLVNRGPRGGGVPEDAAGENLGPASVVSAAPSRPAVEFTVRGDADDAEAVRADALLHGPPSEQAWREAAALAEKSALGGCALGAAIMGATMETGMGRACDPDGGKAAGRKAMAALVEGAEGKSSVWQRWAARALIQKLNAGTAPMEMRSEYNVRIERLMRQALESGDPSAAALAFDYTMHSGVDREEIAVWLEKAAKAGHGMAQFKMGLVCQRGAGVEKDLTKAAEWFEKSSLSGWPHGWAALARISHQAGDKSKAAALLAKAFACAWPNAGNNVIASVFTGQGLPADPELAERWLQRLPEHARADALCETAAQLLTPPAGEPDFSRAESMYARALKSGRIPIAALDTLANAATALEMGAPRATPPRKANAAEGGKWLRRAAEAGYPYAMLLVARDFATGRNGLSGKKAARQWYEKAAATGDLLSLRMCGQFLEEQHDDAAALAVHRQGAEAGHHHSMRSLADMLAAGRGTSPDVAQAVQWYRRAAEQGDAIAAAGDPYALIALGADREAAKDDVKLAAVIRTLAEKGEPAAMYCLALRCSEGRGVKVNFSESLAWFEKAAAAGEVAALYRTGRSYAKGLGTPENPAKAAEWYTKGAAAGDPDCMRALGILNENNNDGKGAASHYEDAALGNDADSMLNLGDLFAAGTLVPKDAVQARGWYELAAMRADDPDKRRTAASKLIPLARGMTEEQFAQAREFARLRLPAIERWLRTGKVD